MTRELRGLTGLRIVAAVWVFLFHVHIRFPLTDQWHLDRILSQGAVGMTVFFMLSGFILAYRYADGALDLRAYAANRFARIYPIYALAGLCATPWLLADVAAMSAEGGAAEAAWLPAARVALLVFACALMIQAWIPQMFSQWNIGASWSLSAEAFFYAVFPGVLRPLMRLGAAASLGALGLFYLVNLLPEAAYRLMPDPPPHPDRVFVYYAMPAFRLSEFLMGVALFNLSRRLRPPTWALDAACLALAGALALHLAWNAREASFFTGHNLVAAPAVGVALLALSREDGLLSAALGSGPMVWGGRISYCFYMFQSPVLSAMVDFRDRLPEDVLPMTFVVLAALTAVSAAAYHGVEEPARRALRSGRRRARSEPDGDAP